VAIALVVLVILIVAVGGIGLLSYTVPKPDQALLVSGGRQSQDAPFQVIVGRGKFVVPIFRKARFLSLAMNEAGVTDSCVTVQGITLDVQAVIAFKVGADTPSIVAAGQRFLSLESSMPTLVGQIFAGHLRAVIGSMTVEEIVRERQKLAEAVLGASATELGKLGLVVDAFQIQKVDDRNIGYIDAMAAPHNAEIQKSAKVAQARAAQAAAMAEQESIRNQAQYSRDTAQVQAGYEAEVQVSQAQATQKAVQAQQESDRNIAEFTKATNVAKAEYDAQTRQAEVTATAEVQVAQAQATQKSAQAQQESDRSIAEFTKATNVARAQYDAETKHAEATAAQAGPLASAKAQQDVVAQQTALAQREGDLREKQLVAEVVKPAEAEAERILVLARANAEQTRIAAEAAASSNRIALDQMLIEQLPTIVEKAAGALAGSNLTVLNGADGVSEIVTGMLGQGMAIFDSVRKGLAVTQPDQGRQPASHQPQPTAPPLP